jgi:hypothetical protein
MRLSAPGPARLLIPFIKKVCAPPSGSLSLRMGRLREDSVDGQTTQSRPPPAAASIKSASISEHFKNTLAAPEMRKLNL